jgi:tetratricopeptide (TPR) repeat protein
MWLGELAAARSLAEAARGLALQLGDSGGAGAALQFLGAMENSQGNVERAQELLKDAAALRRATGNRPGEATCVHLLAEATLGIDFAAALLLFSEALAIRRNCGDALGEAHSLNYIGYVEQKQGNFAAARRWVQEALAIQRRIGDSCGEAYSLLDISALECSEGSYSAALPLLEQSATLMELHGDRAGQAYVYSSLGNIEYARGNHEDAGSLFVRSMNAWLEFGSRGELACTCAMAGAVLAGSDQLPAAARALYGGQNHAAALGHIIDPGDRRTIDSGMALLDAAAASGDISTTELARCKAESEATEIELLAAQTLAALKSTAQLHQRRRRGEPESEAVAP